MNVLITGGAGFIGSHLAETLAGSHDVFIYDNFNKQVHGNRRMAFSKLPGRVSAIIGDVRDKRNFHSALKDKDCIIHLAAETGTGQSMYKMKHYSDVNIGGTAILCDYVMNCPHNISKLVVASSRAIYGEGRYHCRHCGPVCPENRSVSSVIRYGFDPVCPLCGSSKRLSFRKTEEKSAIHPSSIYGITKQVQEQMVLMAARLKGISAFALRYQNVYGPGQSLLNPYTGIISIFANMAQNNATINIFEDGKESRDFVYIDDAVAATVSCLESPRTGQYALNVGSGSRTSVLKVARKIIACLHSKSKIAITGRFREGDIRHNCADLSSIGKLLGFRPTWAIDDGLRRFLSWAKKQEVPSIRSRYDNSLHEAETKGMFVEQ